MSQRICSFVGCERVVRALELCATHYNQRRRGRDLTPIRQIRVPRPTAEQHFFSCVAQEGDCWTWVRTRDVWGYGIFRRHDYEGVAHRWAYEHFIADIPDGLDLDHLCRNRPCVNPWHLEPVTNRVNVLRGVSFSAINAAKTHCIHGHEFTPDNIIPASSGGRKCRTCDVTMRRNKRRRRAAEARLK